jgi:hypothetical protein
MFDAVEGLEWNLIAAGVVWALALGFAAGNYACSLVHRLPRGRLLLDKKPYCGNCGTMLAVKDLFPVISAVSLGHRCRYCKQSFPLSHTWTEIIVGLVFVLAFLQYNFSEQFLFIVLLGTFLITLAAIHTNEGVVMGRVVLCIAIFGLLFRVLQDHTIYNAFDGALYSGLAGVLIWRKQIKPVAHVYSVPDPVLLLLVGGMCVGASQMFLFWGLFAGCYIAAWVFKKLSGSEKPVLLTKPFFIAMMVPILYPELVASLGLEISIPL